jgi:multiple sugar transport system substrate-binding protein
MGDLNWDMVSMPSPSEHPGVGGTSPFNIVTLTSTSKEKDAAFQVIMTILSDEAQTAVAKFGLPSPLTADKYKQIWGEDIPGIKGKNTMAIFKNKPAPLVDDTEYDGLVNKGLASALKDVFMDKKDINTALREAEEAGNTALETAKTK